MEKMKFCILLMLADKIFTCVAPIVSEKEQALPATSILFDARKSVGSGSVFSLSFRSFLSLFIRNKRERKGHFRKNFLFQNSFYFFLLWKSKKKKVTKKKKL